MKKHINIFAVMLMAILMLACTTNFTCHKGDGKSETQVRNITGFESVNFMTAGNVFISQGDVESVTIEAPSDVINEIITDVDNRTLTINSDVSVCPEKFNIYITMKDINSFKLFGSGNIYNFTPLKSDEINLKVSGSGNINFTDVETKKVGLLIMGSGNISIKGRTSWAIMEIGGLGSINAMELNSEFCDVFVNGSGETKTLVNKDLKVKIRGSGDVKYLGEPETIKMDVIGSGEIKKIKAVS